MNPIRPLFLGLGCLLAVAGTVPAQYQQGPATLRLARTGAGTALSVDGAVPFHETSNEVLGARVIDLEGPGLVAVWREKINDRQIEPWYGISLDGSSFAAVKHTSYQIKMRRQRFDPLVGAPQFLDSKLPAAAEVYIVQFQTQPIDEYLSAMADTGALVYKFVSNHSYLVRMSPSVRDQVRALPFVRWVGGYHPEYRLEPYILAGIDTDTLEPKARYNIQVFERGLHQKQIVAEWITGLGGTVEPLWPELYLMEATLTPAQLIQVAALDEVLFIDRWSPPEEDLNVVRTFSGFDALEALTGWTGEDVSGEIMDSGLYTNHADFQHNGGPLVRANGTSTSHGTQVTGVVFGDGSGNPTWRGLLPDGKIVFRTYNGVTNSNRYNLTLPLVDPGQPYKCVFQTNSWGDSQTTLYTNASTVMDDIIFDTDLLITQSQSNTGNNNSRPQAWAKNIVSVGGINHNNTKGKGDDFWCCGSTGPAEDGRVKPDLGHFYDSVTTPAAGGVTNYASFGGTSCATPCTAGSAGIFYQMWHMNAFANSPTGISPFFSRPHFTTAKAALISTANQWVFSGGGHNLRRVHQGWGAADVENLYLMRDKTFWVDQSDVIDNLETITYFLDVLPGEDELKVTLTWPEQGGTTSSSQHRFNDLDLRVTEPGGATYYWGGRGLKTENYSTPFGAPKDQETVETVFIEDPAAGSWTIEVIATELTDDIVPTSGGMNAVFSLWATGGTEGSGGPVNYCTSGTSASGCTADLSAAGFASASASSGFVVSASDVEGNKDGTFFFATNGQQANAWGNGTSFQCVIPPVVRGGSLTGSGTNGACDGTFAQDLNATWCASCPFPAKNPGAGAVVQLQCWYRDPNNTSNQTTSLSDAIEFSVAP